MGTPPAQLALWYEDAARVLGVEAEVLLRAVGSRVCFKRDLVAVAPQLDLGPEAMDKLEQVLPGERGRG